jgi:hypothetical protein
MALYAELMPQPSSKTMEWLSFGRISRAGGVVHRTIAVTSFDGPLVPQALRARTRTKYVPGLTPAARNDVDGLPVSVCVMSAPPGREPASSTYDVGLPTAAVHESVTVEPLTWDRRPVGAAGAPPHGPGPPPPTTSIAIDDGVPTPTAFPDRTRT